MRGPLCLILIALASPALAQGPGSRIRTTPQVPMPARDAQNDAREDTKRCEGLPEDLRQRCLAEARDAAAQRKPAGPESVGGSPSGAGSGANSGTSGAAGSGGSTPR